MFVSKSAESIHQEHSSSNVFAGQFLQSVLSSKAIQLFIRLLNATKNLAVKCSICAKEFLFEIELRAHNQQQQEKYECYLRSKEFHTEKEFSAHKSAESMKLYFGSWEKFNTFSYFSRFFIFCLIFPFFCRLQCSISGKVLATKQEQRIRAEKAMLVPSVTKVSRRNHVFDAIDATHAKIKQSLKNKIFS